MCEFWDDAVHPVVQEQRLRLQWDAGVHAVALPSATAAAAFAATTAGPKPKTPAATASNATGAATAGTAHLDAAAANAEVVDHPQIRDGYPAWRSGGRGGVPLTQTGELTVSSRIALHSNPAHAHREVLLKPLPRRSIACALATSLAS